MKKTLARLVLALGVGVTGLVAGVPSAGAQGDDAKGPDCAEILGGSATYTFGETPLTRVARSRIDLLAPACPAVTYTFTISYTTTTGTAASVTTTQYTGTGTTIELAVTVSDPDAPVDITGRVTTAKRAKAYDESEASISFEVGGSGGGSYQG